MEARWAATSSGEAQSLRSLRSRGHLAVATPGIARRPRRTGARRYMKRSAASGRKRVVFLRWAALEEHAVLDLCCPIPGFEKEEVVVVGEHVLSQLVRQPVFVEVLEADLAATTSREAVARVLDRCRPERAGLLKALAERDH